MSFSANEQLLRLVEGISDTLRQRLGQTSVSSVEIKTSSRSTPDLTVKAYDGSSVTEAGNAALAEYGRLRREIDQRQMNGWKETIEELSR